MLPSKSRRNGTSWLFIVIALGLLLADNLPSAATAALSTVPTDDLASLPVMYE